MNDVPSMKRYRAALQELGKLYAMLERLSIDPDVSDAVSKHIQDELECSRRRMDSAHEVQRIVRTVVYDAFKELEGCVSSERHFAELDDAEETAAALRRIENAIALAARDLK